MCLSSALKADVITHIDIYGTGCWCTEWHPHYMW